MESKVQITKRKGEIENKVISLFILLNKSGIYIVLFTEAWETAFGAVVKCILTSSLGLTRGRFHICCLIPKTP